MDKLFAANIVNPLAFGTEKEKFMLAKDFGDAEDKAHAFIRDNKDFEGYDVKAIVFIGELINKK